jgi:hypothetical protein
MRSAVLLACLLAGSVNVYPEASHIASASRTTEMSPTISETAQPPLLTEAQVNDWVKRWAKRLGLEDWKIEAKIVRLVQLPKGTIANIHWSLPRKHATIKVLDSIDSTLPKSEIVRDTELSVVHELVHLSMAKLPLDSNNTELEEEAVKKISIALVALDKAEAR